MLLVCGDPALARDPTAANGSCATRPDLSGRCFVVHGRLSAYNGAPTFRLWPVGTKRLIGIVPDEDARKLPASIRDEAGFANDIFGRFTVCPFTPARRGVMQFGCIQDVRDARIRTRP